MSFTNVYAQLVTTTMSANTRDDYSMNYDMGTNCGRITACTQSDYVKFLSHNEGSHASLDGRITRNNELRVRSCDINNNENLATNNKNSK